MRRRVPDDLRPIIGKGEIVYSYGTDSFAEAKRRHASEMVQVEARFEQARRQLNAELNGQGAGGPVPPTRLSGRSRRARGPTRSRTAAGCSCSSSRAAASYCGRVLARETVRETWRLSVPPGFFTDVARAVQSAWRFPGVDARRLYTVPRSVPWNGREKTEAGRQIEYPALVISLRR